MRALVTGASGQVGREVVDVLEAAGHDVIAASHADLDVTDRDLVLAALHEVRPDVTFHTATWTAVDDCESDPDRAFSVNALGTRHVVEGVRLTGGHLVTISSDYVFDGTAARPYNEWDEPGPLSVYGRSLLAREREAGTGATIVRTSWVCGKYGNNFAKTMLRLAAGVDEVKVVDDQYGRPTMAADLAAMIVRLGGERRPGTFHVTNEESTSWHGFAQAIFAAAGQDPGRVVAITTAELSPPRPAPRPASAILDNAALRGAGIQGLGPYAPSLAVLVKEFTV